VSNGENSDVTRRLDIDNVVRETRHGASSNRQIRGHAWHERARLGQEHDLVYGCVNGVEEFQSEVFTLRFVPPTGEAIFGVRFVLEPNAQVH
jgi:hypothetical protein